MKLARKITGVSALPDMGRSIAIVDRETGIVYVNSKIWPQLPRDCQEFILLHEKAHLVTGSTDDLYADKMAFKEFVAAGFSPIRAAMTLELLPSAKTDSTLKLRIKLLKDRAERLCQ